MLDLEYVVNNCAGMRSRTVARKITRMYDEALRPIGVTLGQFTMLVGIKLSNPQSISRFADALGMERSTLTRNLKLLEKMGLIELGPERYRRARDVMVTPKGMSVIEAAYPLWEDAQNALRGRVGEVTWSDAHGTMDRFLGSLANIKLEPSETSAAAPSALYD